MTKVQVLITFASSHGATAEIAQTIGTVLRNNHLVVDVKRMEQVKDITPYDAVILGSAIYTHEWMDLAKDFLVEHADVLKKQHIWVFSSGPTGEGNPLELLEGEVLPENVAALVAEVKPRDTVVFGGKIDLRRLRKDERVVVQEENVEKGDFRNWHAIKFWAQQIADALKTVALDKPCDKALVSVADSD